MSLRALLRTGFLAIVLLVNLFASVASAQVCKEDGGTQECVDREQLKPWYIPGSFGTCATVPTPGLPPPPYASIVGFWDEGSALDYTKASLICGQEARYCQTHELVQLYPYTSSSTNPGPVWDARTQPNGSQLGVIWTATSRLPDGSCAEPGFGATKMAVQRPLICPAEYPETTVRFNPDRLGCARPVCKECKVFGNPITIPLRDKIQREVDASLAHEFFFDLSRLYVSSGHGSPLDAPTILTQLGGSWTFEFDHRLSVVQSPVTLKTVARLIRSNHKVNYFFKQTNGSFLGEPDEPGSLSEILDGQGVLIGYRYRNAADRDEEYSLAGRLTRITVQGLSTTFIYDTDSRLTQITSHKGRTLSFYYTGTNPRATGVTLPDGGTVVYVYGLDDDISTVSLPDNASRTYLYESTYAPKKLTAIIDENGVNYAQFGYRASNSEGAQWTQHAGGVERYTVTGEWYSAIVVNTPLGEESRYYYQEIVGSLREVRRDRRPAPGSTDMKMATRSYDANGLLNLETDFNGVTTDHDYGARALETQRIEAKTISGGATPPTKRTIQTDWNATFRVPTERRTYNGAGTLEAKSQWTYNARGQVLTRSDLDVLVPANPARVSTTTYCEASDVAAGTCPLVGLALSVDGPRSDVSDLTSYTYRMADDASCTTGCACTYRKGDLWKVTNALGQVNETISYDKNGRITRQKDANGAVTDLTYHARGWLLTRTVRALASGVADAGDATTTFVYDAVGNVTDVTQPDGAFLHYT